jgi:outer membrane lipoprotein SlyB
VSSQSNTGADALGVYVYPKQGQSASKQSSDESACYKSAAQRTAVNLSAAKPTPAPHATVQGLGARGAARGAAVGAVGGAIGGDAGKGAGYGALAGVIHGRRVQSQANAQAQQQAQYNANVQHAQNLDAVKRAYTACLDARGYSVK